MRLKPNRGSILSVIGILFVQLSVGNVLAADKTFIGQLNPNEKCAWWNTTNPANCDPNQGPPISPNTDPWGQGGDDPIWNYNGPDNGNWQTSDPNSPFSNGNFGGGQFTTPALGTIDKLMWPTIIANYTDEVVDDMNEHGIWNSETQDAVADEIVAKYSRYATYYSISASAGIALLDYLFMEKWRGTGPIMGAITTLGGGGLMLTAAMAEAWAVMRMQITMLLEIMELYGELPSNPVQRQNEASLAMTTGLFGPALNLAVNRILKLVPMAGSIPATVPPTLPTLPGIPGSLPNLPVTPGPLSQTLLGQSGIASASEAEKALPTIMEQTGFAKVAMGRFGKVRFAQFLAENSILVKIAASTAFAALTTYGITNYMGKIYKKNFRKMAKLHEHNVLESFKNNSDAKQAVWLILTKGAFRPDKTDDALSSQDAKLYATIVSQEIPLLHYGKYNEAETLFRQYKASGVDPDKLKLDVKPGPTPKPTPGPTPPSDPFTFPSAPKETPKPQNDIDKKLARLSRDLDLQQKLFFIKIIESGMLMKGFLSSRDNDTLETVAIELGINPPPKLVLKDNDPRGLVAARYKALRDGLVGEVRKKVMASAGAQGVKLDSNEYRAFATNLPPGDMRYSAGEIIMEDFYSPEQKLINNWAERSSISGVIDEKDIAKFQEISPYLEGAKKLPKDTTLPTNRTADGSPRTQPASAKP